MVQADHLEAQAKVVKVVTEQIQFLVQLHPQVVAKVELCPGEQVDPVDPEEAAEQVMVVRAQEIQEVLVQLKVMLVVKETHLPKEVAEVAEAELLQQENPATVVKVVELETLMQ